MTSLMCWIGYESRPVPSSAYIITDSRISWESQTWDFGRKTYASRQTPDIFGYCGDVVFPSLVLSQFVSALDEGLYSGDAKQRHDGLERLVRTSFDKLPKNEQRAFTIVHCGRDGDRMETQFRVFVLKWKDGWTSAECELPVRSSAVVHLDGSGLTSMRTALDRRANLAVGRTTRGLFQSFVDALASEDDPATGGAPQLVGLYRIGPGISFGVLHNLHRFLYGMPVHDLAPESQLDWRTDLFERADGHRKKCPASRI